MTYVEFEVLAAWPAPGSVVQTTMLLERVWGTPPNATAPIDVHIATSEKIEQEPSPPS